MKVTEDNLKRVAKILENLEQIKEELDSDEYDTTEYDVFIALFTALHMRMKNRLIKWPFGQKHHPPLM